jgi:exodeoxyribonuclease V alpha subunit
MNYSLLEPPPEKLAVPLILNLVAKRIPARFGLDPIQQVQLLTPMARGGSTPTQPRPR